MAEDTEVMMAGDPRQTAESEEPTRVDPRISEFEAMVRWPESMKRDVEVFDDLRKYVHTDVFLRDEQNTVGANFILRGQYAVQSQITPRDPMPKLEPFPRVGQIYDPALDGYAETHEALIMQQQHHARLKSILSGCIQDAQTVPMCWLKMRWQESPELDAIGYPRHNDTLDTIQRYKSLRQQNEDMPFPPESAKIAELNELHEQVRKIQIAETREDLERNPPQPMLDDQGLPMRDFASNEIVLEPDDRLVQLQALEAGEVEDASLPEVSHYKGYIFQQVDAEDIRWDWSITRYEDLYAARWMAHRVFMYPEDAKTELGITDAELGAATRFDDYGKVVMEPSSVSDDDLRRGDIEDSHQGQRIAVWEMEHRVRGKVYVWIEGMNRFVDEYTPSARPRRFFSYYLVAFSRVTGRTIGRAPSELQAPLQDEMNMLRTYSLEARQSAHPRYVVTKNTFTPREKELLEEALPYSVTEIEKANDIKNHLHELVPSNYNPALYDRSDTFVDWQAMAGLPMAAIGGMGTANLATEAAIANEQLGAQADFRSDLIQDLLSEIYESMAQMNAQLYEPEEVVERVGEGAVWPEFTSRTALLENFSLKADAALDPGQARRQELEDWNLIVQSMASVGLPLNPIAIGADLLRSMGKRRSLSRYLMAPDQQRALAAEGAPPPEGDSGNRSPAPPQDEPQAQGDQGAAGGRPDMVEPPPPEDVSNNSL